MDATGQSVALLTWLLAIDVRAGPFPPPSVFPSWKSSVPLEDGGGLVRLAQSAQQGTSLLSIPPHVPSSDDPGWVTSDSVRRGEQIGSFLSSPAFAAAQKDGGNTWPLDDVSYLALHVMLMEFQPQPAWKHILESSSHLMSPVLWSEEELEDLDEPHLVARARETKARLLKQHGWLGKAVASSPLPFRGSFTAHDWMRSNVISTAHSLRINGTINGDRINGSRVLIPFPVRYHPHGVASWKAKGSDFQLTMNRDVEQGGELTVSSQGRYNEDLWLNAGYIFYDTITAHGAAFDLVWRPDKDNYRHKHIGVKTELLGQIGLSPRHTFWLRGDGLLPEMLMFSRALLADDQDLATIDGNVSRLNYPISWENERTMHQILSSELKLALDMRQEKGGGGAFLEEAKRRLVRGYHAQCLALLHQTMQYLEEYHKQVKTLLDEKLLWVEQQEPDSTSGAETGEQAKPKAKKSGSREGKKKKKKKVPDTAGTDREL